MAAREFKYYDDWKTSILTCPQCGWSGTFEQGSVDDELDELSVSSCPVCRGPDVPELAIVWSPTLAETEAHWDKLSPEQRATLVRRKHFLAEVERTSLKSPDELPDLPGSELVLSWDIREDREKKLWTDIRHGDTVLWSEMAVYEGGERFAEVVAILKQKYGARLADVVPTKGSETFLYGDHYRFVMAVKEAREALRQPREAGGR